VQNDGHNISRLEARSQRPELQPKKMFFSFFLEAATCSSFIKKWLQEVQKKKKRFFVDLNWIRENFGLVSDFFEFVYEKNLTPVPIRTNWMCWGVETQEPVDRK